MPLLRRQPFQKQKPPPGLKPDDEVFHCKLTNEIFTNYEQFFERIILCNSLVWTCALTGRPGLTYQEALESEDRARKQLASFPDPLQKPILFLATLTHRSRLMDMNDDVFSFVKDRFFVGELVEVTVGNDRKSCRVLRVVPPPGVFTPVKDAPGEVSSDDDVICLDDPEPVKSKFPKSSVKAVHDEPNRYQYVVQEKKGRQYTVKAGQINRKKGMYTREKSKLYLKQHCDSEGTGIWKVKAKYVKKHKLHEVTWSAFSVGPTPNFGISEAKKIPRKKEAVIDLTGEKKKKKLTKEEKLAKKKEIDLTKMTAEERAEYKEREKQEKLAAKQAMKDELKKKLEIEKLKRKEEREKEKEKKREEKSQREEYMREWNRMRDDLECDDLKPLPKPTPIQLAFSPELFGDVVLVLEYLTCFDSLFDIQVDFPDGIDLEKLCKSLVESDMNGLYLDLLKFLLQAIFNLQTEEEEEEEELQQNQKLDMPVDALSSGQKGDLSTKDLVRAATIASKIPQLTYGSTLSKLHLENFTISEIIRLHFLSSGAEMSDRDAKFRYQQRGGYTSYDDAGLEFRRQEPELMLKLERMSVFDLEPVDKLKILTALIGQLLTYVACREFIEDNYEKLRAAKIERRQHQAAEEKRNRDEAAYWWRKRCEEKAKEREAEAEKKAQKRKEREERLRLDEMRKRAKAEKRDLYGLLLDEGEVDLIERLESDAKLQDKKDKEKAEGKEETSPKDSKKDEPGRTSGRLKNKKEEFKKREKDMAYETMDWDHIDWEKVTEEDKAQWKERGLQKDKELCQFMYEYQHGNAIVPLGRDRTFRRYWSFQSIPGIFVEDQEMHIPDDYLQPVEQSNKPQVLFESDQLPLTAKNANHSGEAKSISSDKENDVGQGCHSHNDRNQNKAKVLTENGTADSTANSPMDMDENKSTVTLETVDEQVCNSNRIKWAFFNTPEQLDKLIESLNSRGFREGPLKVALQDQKALLQASIASCPVKSLCIESNQTTSMKGANVHPVRSRNKVLQGKVYNSSAEELLELNLREMLLDLEERMYAGALGALKIEDRAVWRNTLESGGYEKSCNTLVWSGKSKADETEGVPDSEKMETDSDGESDDKSVSLVSAMAMALLQIEQGMEPKYLNPPLGEDEESKQARQQALLEAAFKGLQGSPTPKKPLKESKTKEEDDSSSDSDNEEDEEQVQKLKTPVERWEESLMKTTSLAQIFLHLHVLEKSISWTKSALNARCRICRRKGDAEKMLLCDLCDRGHHMYCLKPPVKTIPSGDWYCPTCRPKDIMRTPRKARRQSSLREEEEEDDEDSSDQEEDSTDNDNISEEEGDDSSEEEESEDEDSDEEVDEEEEESDEESTPAKIKILKGKKQLFPPLKSQPSSGRSTPTSVGRSSRGNTPRSGTPTETKPSRGRGRPSLNASHEKKLQKSAEKRPIGRPRKNAENAAAKVTSQPRSANKTTKKRSFASPDEEINSKIRGGESAYQMKLAENLVNELMKHEDAWPFLKPVTKREAPDYFTIVKKPMDFSTIRCNINKFLYAQAADILQDIRLIFSNCEKYNVPSAEEYQAGQRITRMFVKRVKELKLDAVLKQQQNGISPKAGSSRRSLEVPSKRSAESGSRRSSRHST